MDKAKKRLEELKAVTTEIIPTKMFKENSPQQMMVQIKIMMTR